MYKCFLVVLSFCFFIGIAYAENDTTVSLFDEEVDTATKEKKENFLSFMNFEVSDKIFSSSKDNKETHATIEDTIKLANRGNLQAQLSLGYGYLYGEGGLPIDYNKSFEYYTKAAQQNDPVGLNNLASLYYGGLGVKRDVKKAAALFKKASELGNGSASVNIGFMHASGKGAKKDIVLALDYFEKSLTENSPAAKFMLGYAYYKGLHREINYIKAANLLKESADAGFDEAQTLVADIYIKGLGFPQNYNKGVMYLHKAVTQGDANAMVKLADILVEGRKYNRDVEYAYVLYNLASVKGVSSAVQKRNSIEDKMKVNEVLGAQKKSEAFKEELSSITSYIRQTYGEKIVSYFYLKE